MRNWRHPAGACRVRTSSTSSKAAASPSARLKVTAGFADYVLYVDGRPVSVIEAKKVGHTLSGVEGQAADYSEGLPAGVDAPIRPLPFLYVSTGAETCFTNLLPAITTFRVLFPGYPVGLSKIIGRMNFEPQGHWVPDTGDEGRPFTVTIWGVDAALLARTHMVVLPPVDASPAEDLDANVGVQLGTEFQLWAMVGDEPDTDRDVRLVTFTRNGGEYDAQYNMDHFQPDGVGTL